MRRRVPIHPLPWIFRGFNARRIRSGDHHHRLRLDGALTEEGIERSIGIREMFDHIEHEYHVKFVWDQGFDLVDHIDVLAMPRLRYRPGMIRDFHSKSLPTPLRGDGEVRTIAAAYIQYRTAGNLLLERIQDLVEQRQDVLGLLVVP